MTSIKTLEGHLDGSGHRIGVVCARFNDAITERLLASALDCLRRHGVREADRRDRDVPALGRLEVRALERHLVAEASAEVVRVDARPLLLEELLVADAG